MDVPDKIYRIFGEVVGYLILVVIVAVIALVLFNPSARPRTVADCEYEPAGRYNEYVACR